MTPADVLRAALTTDPARPAITFHDGPGARVELSVATLDNWVAKTANLLTEELDAGPGTTVGVDLPVHWLGAVWLLGCWTVGAQVVLGPRTDVDVDVVVAGSGGGPAAVPAGPRLVVVGTAPLGGPAAPAGALPPHALDFGADVPQYGDRWVGPPPGPAVGAVSDRGTALSAADLAAAAVAAAAEHELGPGGAVLVTSPWTAVPDTVLGLLAPLHAGAPVVLAAAEPPAPVVAQERVRWRYQRPGLRPVAAGQPG